MYSIIFGNRFKKQLEKCYKQGKKKEDFHKVIKYLQATGTVPSVYKPHKLVGNLIGHWECHIKPDWLLIWTINDDEIEIELTETGTHSELFR